MPTHVCTNEELGIDIENENSFYPLKNTNDQSVIKDNLGKFVCTDKEQLYIKGNFDSKKARLIEIQLEICKDEPD